LTRTFLSTGTLADPAAADPAAIEEQDCASSQSKARLQSLGRESVSSYGRALFIEHGDRVAKALDALLTRFVLDPLIAGPHYCALPLLLHFSTKGAVPIAAVSLKAVLDQLSRRHTHRRLAGAIGRAIEDEVKAGRIAARDRDVLRLLKRHQGKAAVVSSETLQSLRVGHTSWTTTDRFEVGALLLQLVIEETKLLRLVRQSVRGRQTLMVEPTELATETIRRAPEDQAPLPQGPKLEPPRDWLGPQGLVSRRDGLPLDYLHGADLKVPLQVVNHLQAQALMVDPWMAQQQSEAWSANLRGLFSVTRDPQQAPARPEADEDRAAWRQWRREAREAWAEERKNKGPRQRIQESLNQAVAVAGEPIWFGYVFDFRGRAYTSNRRVTHQGPDFEKGLVNFRSGLPCDETAAEWILKAAASHWGLSRSSWAERLQWGRDNIERLLAIAEAPLDRLELWRDAKEPWQLLQMARAWSQWLNDPSTPITAPIRFDQTTSGLGIAAALVRDKALARETNLVGTTRHDIYVGVAAKAVRALQLDLESGTPAQQRYAAVWLELGVDRALVKGPVMSSVYGAQLRSIFDGLADHLIEHVELQQAADYQRQIVLPARYMAQKLQQVLAPEIAPLLELKRWLEGISAVVVKRQRGIRWTSPMGLPVLLAGKQPANPPAPTLLHGSRGWRTEDSSRRRHELSARATSRGITANLIHSFDAALLHALICRAEDVGAEVLPNHDCFAAVPALATWLHRTVHSELRTLYLPEWLDEISAEIACNAGLKQLPSPPMVGTLVPGEIGQNSYCFS
jgi:DNA-directed RNA polymerase